MQVKIHDESNGYGFAIECRRFKFEAVAYVIGYTLSNTSVARSQDASLTYPTL